MCMSDKEYAEYMKMGEERWKKAKLLRNDHRIRLEEQILKFQREVDAMYYMSPAAYEKAYLAPPTEKVEVRRFTSRAEACVIADEVEAAHNKSVFLDITTDADGKTVLCAVDKEGAVIDTLLTFASDGVVDRKQKIKPEVGLALGRDGSLRGRIKA